MSRKRAYSRGQEKAASQGESERLRNCPICGDMANNPHHVKPRSLGGTDEPRNIVYLCKPCHDATEEYQEKTGKEFSSDLISDMVRELHIRLDTDNSTVYSYQRRDGHDFLVWIILPGHTKRYINQFIDGQPSDKQEGDILPDQGIIVKPSPKRHRGRPPNDNIHTSYLERLISSGSSLRQISQQLKVEGFRLTHAGIRRRIIKSGKYNPQLETQCKMCGKLFSITGTRRVYCSPECYNKHRR